MLWIYITQGSSYTNCPIRSLQKDHRNVPPQMPSTAYLELTRLKIILDINYHGNFFYDDMIL